MKLWIWNRKKFIVAGNMLMISLFLFAGCSRQPEKVTLADTAMGTVIQETLYTEDVTPGDETARAIISGIEALEQECLSWRVETSEIGRINETAGSQEGWQLSEDMEAALRQIWQVSEKSNGALDVTVGEITRLWDLDTWSAANEETQRNFQVPKEALLEEVLANTGYNKVTLEGDRIYLPEGMSLDLGAVGKGIACDRIGDFLAAQESVSGAVISVGGSIVTYGSKPDGTDWNVAIIHPREDGVYLGMLSLQGECYVSTSGDYERYIEKDGVRYHHIMNPATGYPADSGVCSVTVLSDSGLLSDALSTACFVLGVEDGMKLAEEFGAEALFVTDELEIYMTDGMSLIFSES